MVLFNLFWVPLLDLSLDKRSTREVSSDLSLSVIL